jgi:hypothetical protein
LLQQAEKRERDVARAAELRLEKMREELKIATKRADAAEEGARLSKVVMAKMGAAAGGGGGGVEQMEAAAAAAAAEAEKLAKAKAEAEKASTVAKALRSAASVGLLLGRTAEAYSRSHAQLPAANKLLRTGVRALEARPYTRPPVSST